MFNLAGHLGRTVRELQLSMSRAEFTDWIAYSQVQPFGEPAQDFRHGSGHALLANINRDSKRRSEPFTWQEFMPWHKTKQYLKNKIRKALGG